MFVVYFPEQCIVGRPFYSKENVSALNFAVQEDDKFAAYSTSLFFPPVQVFCVFSKTVFCREALLQLGKCVRQNFAVQEDDKFAAYSTSLFFLPVHVFCVLS